jgi:hypothetical protein
MKQRKSNKKTELGIEPTKLREDIIKAYEDKNLPLPQCYNVGNCFVIIEKVNNKLNMIISNVHRMPFIQEVEYARKKLLPNDKKFFMYLPCDNEVNIFKNSYHVFEAETEKNKKNDEKNKNELTN